MKTIKTISVALVCAALFIGCGMLNQTKSPTEVLKAMNEASKKKDVEAIKSYLSKGTLELLDKSAKSQEKSVDELLKADDGAPFEELPETRNEKIEGDTATVEIKNKTTDSWEKLPFVKEEGNWKIALDKFMEDMIKRLTEEMNKIPDDAMPPSDDLPKPESEDNSKTETNKK